MRASLQNRCSLFIANRDMIKSAFSWESTYMYPLCAGLFATRGLAAHADKMRECRDLLKRKTGFFSNFRGTSRMATIASLALSSNPVAKLDRMLYVYGRLKEVFFPSEYLTVASSAIVDLAEPAQYDYLARRTREIYDHMKSAHPFLTSSEDSAFAALLALSGLDSAYIEDEMERCYRLLKQTFFSGNAVQSLSHVLALGDKSAEYKCGKAVELYSLLKRYGSKYGTGYELSTLGALALLDVDTAVLAGDILEVNTFLKTQKGFGPFGVGSRQRLMYAGMLTMCDYMPDVQTMQVAALNGVVSLVIAQQAAICACVAATGAASASAAGSGSG